LKGKKEQNGKHGVELELENSFSPCEIKIIPSLKAKAVQLIRVPLKSEKKSNYGKNKRTYGEIRSTTSFKNKITRVC
jgi:hypothetical protein